MKEEEILIQKLDTLIKLTTLGLIEKKSQTEQIILLSKVGFAPKEIADLIGTTPNTVRVGLTHIRKTNKKRRKNGS
jgi:DNA-binding CsgD family transcriptional regulator